MGSFGQHPEKPDASGLSYAFYLWRLFVRMALLSRIALTLMKGDEVIELLKKGANSALLIRIRN